MSLQASLLANPTSTSSTSSGSGGDLERKSRKISVAIGISAWIGFIFSLVALAVTGAVLFISTTLSSDKKVFFASVLLVCGAGLQLVVCISRHEPVALLLFTQLSGFVCALALGLSISYAS